MNNYSFIIQANNPFVQIPLQKEYEQISSAIQNIFPMETEDLILRWNRMPIKVEYKYDLSILIDDIIYMLEKLIFESKGEYRVGWGSDTFRGSWQLTWENNIITIKSIWDSIVGNYIDALNKENKIQLELNNFISEWKIVLKKIIESFEKAGIVITEERDLLNKMYEIESKIPKYGKLYSHLND